MMTGNFINIVFPSSPAPPLSFSLSLSLSLTRTKKENHLIDINRFFVEIETAKRG